jgi:hypothetical protein
VPRKEHLGRVYPALSADVLDSLVWTMERVRTTVWRIATLGAEAKLGKEEMIAMLQAEHPFLRRQGLSRAFSLANYYSWHEGYEK